MEVRFLADHTHSNAFAAVRFTRIVAGDYCAEVTGQSRGFRGHLAEVSFFRCDVERFVADLRAALAGTSSGDIRLEPVRDSY